MTSDKIRPHHLARKAILYQRRPQRAFTTAASRLSEAIKVNTS
jgi:hypothetical protein